MKELIRAVRAAAGMSQEQFARELGASVVSINRWENGKSRPGNMTQRAIYQFCRDKGIDLAGMILEHKTVPSREGKLVLYHGSRSGIQGDIAPISRAACDFGQGFYMGNTALQPLTLVCAEEKPRFYAMELDTAGLQVLRIDVGMDWAMVIACFRGELEAARGTALYDRYAAFANGYDLIVGPIADDRMFVELNRFFSGTLTDQALLHCLSALDLGMQYVAVTPQACQRIRVIREDILSELELQALRDMSARRRQEGIALADTIEKRYRREGRYFDELLRGDDHA